MVIDPVLTSSTYLGGSRDETGMDIASGNTYMAGTTRSADFADANSSNDVRLCGFITKLNPAGQFVYTKLLEPVAGDNPYFESAANAVAVGPDGLPVVSYDLTAYSAEDSGGIRSIPGATRHVVKLTEEGETLHDTVSGAISTDFFRVVI